MENCEMNVGKIIEVIACLEKGDEVEELMSQNPDLPIYFFGKEAYDDTPVEELCISDFGVYNLVIYEQHYIPFNEFKDIVTEPLNELVADGSITREDVVEFLVETMDALPTVKAIAVYLEKRGD